MTAVDVDPEPALDTPPPSATRRRVPRLLIELLAVAVATVAILIPALQLWKANLSVPFVYAQTERSPYSYAGDAPFYLMMSQGMQVHGTYLENPSLGWPNGQQLYDLPHGADNLNLLSVRILGALTGDPVAAVNLFFLLTFVTVALAAYLALRCFAISRWVSGALALLYAFAPYHFARGTAHVLLSSYFMAPIGLLLIARLASATPPLTNDRSRPSLRGHGGWVVVLACAGLASTGAYYGIMTMIIIAFVAPIVALAQRNWRPLLSGALVAGTIALFIGLNLAPSFIYWAQNGRAPDVAARFATETEINGLKVTQMFLPARGHWLFGDLAERPNRDSRVPSERGQELGAIAAAGLLATVGAVLVIAFAAKRPARAADADALTADDPPGPPLDIMRRNGATSFVLVGIAAIGGLSLLLSQTVLSEIRSWNRVSIYLMFFGLLAVGFGLDRVRAWLATRSAPKWLFPVIVAVVLVFGCFDQITSADVPAYARNARLWNSQQSFIAQVTKELPKGAAVFELPYLTFPEPGAQGGMGPYDHIRGFLARPDLNWSWGESRNRTPNWQAALFDGPGPQQLEGIAAVGFDGLLIDRAGCPDSCALAELAYSEFLNQQPQVSSDGRLAYYDLRQFRAEQRQRLGDAGVEQLRRETLSRGVVAKR
ncbi:MAG: hypothetical protein ACOYNI_01845 [Acidimicrobiia bacterium]